MLFLQELTEQIVKGNKTQTRRPIKDGEQLVERDGLKTVLTASGRIKHQQWRLRAIPYKYGKPTRWRHNINNRLLPYERYEQYKEEYGDEWETWLRWHSYTQLKIRITDIRQEDVREISHGDAVAEGFNNRSEFWSVWCNFYDPTVTKTANGTIVGHMVDQRPDGLYQAFVYDFELY